MDTSLPRIFVSHSSKDHDFAIRLVDDLQRELGDESAVWYDARGGLRGGDTWWRKIVQELTTRNVFLVILSPNSMESQWVNDEIDLAWRQKNSPGGKRIIPVLYQPCEIRQDLASIQVISFLQPKPYEVAFNELLYALNLMPTHADHTHLAHELDLIPNQQTNPRFLNNSKQVVNAEQEQSVQEQEVDPAERHLDAAEKEKLTSHSKVPLLTQLSTSRDIDALYLEGLKFLSQRKLDDAISTLQQVLNHDQNYAKGKLAVRMIKLLDQQARRAHYTGNWDQEISAWKALLQLDSKYQSNPQYKRALIWLPIAEKNRQYQVMYEDALQLFNENDMQGAKNHLKELWIAAPNYGDPEDLARSVGVKVPLQIARSRRLLWILLWVLLALGVIWFVSSVIVLHNIEPPNTPINYQYSPVQNLFAAMACISLLLPIGMPIVLISTYPVWFLPKERTE